MAIIVVTYVRRKCEDGPEQAEGSELHATSSWQEDMEKILDQDQDQALSIKWM